MNLSSILLFTWIVAVLAQGKLIIKKAFTFELSLILIQKLVETLNELDFISKYCTIKDGNKVLDCISDEEIFDSILLFSSIAENHKHFKQIRFSNAAITGLKANTFQGITFNEIVIEDCFQLETIDEMAFNGTEEVTKRLIIKDNPKLTSTDNKIWKVLSKFTNVEIITLARNNITEIPDYALGKLSKLHSLTLAGTTFKKLGNFAFAKLANLESLQFESIEFENIPTNAFTFEKPSRKVLTLTFKNIKTFSFGQTPVELPTLSNINRHTNIVFEGEESMVILNWLDVVNFLKINEKNTLDIGPGYIPCFQCPLFLEYGLSTVMSRVKNVKCLEINSLHNPRYRYYSDGQFKKCLF